MSEKFALDPLEMPGQTVIPETTDEMEADASKRCVGPFDLLLWTHFLYSLLFMPS